LLGAGVLGGVLSVVVFFFFFLLNALAQSEAEGDIFSEEYNICSTAEVRLRGLFFFGQDLY